MGVLSCGDTGDADAPCLACAATVLPSQALPLANLFVIREKERKKNKRIIKKKKKKRYVLIPQQLSCNMVWFHCRVGGLARAYTSMCFQLLLVWLVMVRSLV